MIKAQTRTPTMRSTGGDGLRFLRNLLAQPRPSNVTCLYFDAPEFDAPEFLLDLGAKLTEWKIRIRRDGTLERYG